MDIFKNVQKYKCTKSFFKVCQKNGSYQDGKRDFRRTAGGARIKFWVSNNLGRMFRKIMGSKKSPKVDKKFYCEDCDYSCCKKSDFTKHLSTEKHKMVVNGSTKVAIYKCECGRSYKYDSGFYRHRKQCQKQPVKSNMNDIKTLFMQQKEEQKQRDDEMKKQHKEELQMLTDKISSMSLVTNNNNTMNNKFNLNFFLNTQCKDAIDFQTFLQDHLHISQEDLFYFGNNGYVNGMMNIIDRSLGGIDFHKRPLHCTDVKRKIMYYKQRDGSWEKDEEKKHLKTLVKNIDNKTMNCLENWEEGHKYKYEDLESQNFKWYFRVASETLGGDSSRDDQYMAKIMHHIATETYVKKTQLVTI